MFFRFQRIKNFPMGKNFFEGEILILKADLKPNKMVICSTK